jgi:signal transduction histidine kinase
MNDDAAEPPLSRLLQHAGHELRNPLGAVIGYMRMLLKRQAGDITEAQERLLNEALKSSGRLHGVLDEISLLAKIDRGEERLNPAKVELGKVVKDAIGSLAADPDDPAVIDVQLKRRINMKADPERLKSALAAVLFALRRELVTTERLVASLHTAEGHAIIAIAPADEVDALAREPLQALTPFNDYRGGCGLRLAIARRIIDQHKGTIHGKGLENKAIAVVRLPLT